MQFSTSGIIHLADGLINDNDDGKVNRYLMPIWESRIPLTKNPKFRRVAI